MELIKLCFEKFWNFLGQTEFLGIPLASYLAGSIILVVIVSYAEGRRKK